MITITWIVAEIRQEKVYDSEWHLSDVKEFIKGIRSTNGVMYLAVYVNSIPWDIDQFLSLR